MSNPALGKKFAMVVGKKGISKEMQSARLAQTTYGLVPPIISRQDRRGGARANAKGAKEKGVEEENLKGKDAKETPNLQVMKVKSPASILTMAMGIAGLQTGVIIATKSKVEKGKMHLL